MSLKLYFTDTRREILLVCPACSTTVELTAPIDSAILEAKGFELVDGTWTGACPSCDEKRVDASNAEFEALACACAELSRLHHSVTPLNFVEIPSGEGFLYGGETRFGFWAACQDSTDLGFTAFRQSARRIVASLNRKRDTALVVNATATQMIVHGIVG